MEKSRVIFDTGADGNPIFLVNGRSISSATRVVLEWTKGGGVVVIADGDLGADEDAVSALVESETDLFIHGDVELVEPTESKGKTVKSNGKSTG